MTVMSVLTSAKTERKVKKHSRIVRAFKNLKAFNYKSRYLQQI
jgi:hypothetical protein